MQIPAEWNMSLFEPLLIAKKVETNARIPSVNGVVIEGDVADEHNRTDDRPASHISCCF